MDWNHFLSGTPAKDYIFQKEPYEDQIKKAAEYLKAADAVLIGAGAGLSEAAGLHYGGKRFSDHFGDFIKKYGMQDMYSAGFYPFETEEAKWGYWARNAYVNRIAPPAMPLYQQLFELVKEKDYFVLTTNVDHQFEKAGFDEKKIFATQGDYGLIQCMRGCHDKTYDATEMFCQMNQAEKDCLVPSYMVPKCPVCGGPMAMNLRCDQYFVQDEHWYEAAKNYDWFLRHLKKKNVLLLEFGVGFNTPAIIRFPFENMVREHKNVKLVRFNRDEAVVPESFGERGIGISADMAQSIRDLAEVLKQEKRLDYLLEKFKEDSGEYKDLDTDVPEPEKRKILRSLMNIRMPRTLDEKVQKVQDEFLQEDVREKGIVHLSDIPTVQEQYHSDHAYAGKLSIWQGDITRLGIDAIVNAANSQMLGCFVPCHKCIDNAIHSAAGIELRAECNRKMNQKRARYGMAYEEPNGMAMLTKGYNLPAKYVIHTVGPVVGYQVTDSQREDLRNCYESVLTCCVEHGIRSVAFCCISTGEFRFPNDEAAKIAVDTVTAFLGGHAEAFDRVIFNVFKDLDREYYEELVKYVIISPAP